MQRASVILEQENKIKTLTQEQIETLAEFAENYREGRKILCFVFRSLVAIGAMAGAVTGLWQAIAATDFFKIHFP